MVKFNKLFARRSPTSPVGSEHAPSGVTFEGGPGYARDAKSELFLLAVTNMVGEHTFYEPGGARDERFAGLVRQVAVDDPEWTARLLRWLRTGANMRTASLVGAAEFVKARLDAGADGGAVTNRGVVDGVLQRADEPGELLAYWMAVHGRAVPKPVKRGVADAVLRLYDERALVKWDSAARAVRFGDVLNLVHPPRRTDRQADLFRHALDRRYGRDGENGVPPSLSVLTARAELMAWPPDRRTALFEQDRDTVAATLRAAGMTWESVAGWLQGPMTAQVWESLLPSMGYMACLRNLRNLDEAGVSDDVAARVAARIADPEQVARSRQLPMRFLSAYRAVPSLRWAWALEQAVTHSLAHVPELGGRTLVLVDTSGSMGAVFSRDGTLRRWDAALVFGLALASRCAHADVVSFSSNYNGAPPTKVFPLRPRESLLKAVDRWHAEGYFLGVGTDTAHAVRTHLRRGFHDRVVILTDEQAADGDVGAAVPADVPLYTWNLAGHRHGHAPSGGHHRHTFGGLSDQAFGMIPLLEAGRNADWPF